ncbi:GCN5 family N-acetyltransferase [Desulfitobacterium metallireducens DSM 15288]|uniref:GCN5 family N-acetyltransferase n=1 Tax=Desulfitobacterium metallireducens DSM 15288 TaxID=871968 RepID=W0EA80_9FIRM|nr:GCN5 family N-acetyltransferase [Desulfitobacterium metallireducens DSM 15288]
MREIEITDAKELLELCLKLDKETQFMMLEEGERQQAVDKQQDQINRVLSTHNQIIFIATNGDQIVGYLGAYGGEYRRNAHSAYIVIGILKDYIGQGIGTRLFQTLEQWAYKCGIHRLELTVMAHNLQAFALYKKVGFTIEGIKKHSIHIDGSYVDEYYMVKLL